MNKISTSGIAFLLLFATNAAVAADNKAHTVVPDNWNGIYIGADLGAGLGTTRRDWPATNATTGDYSANGAMGGITAGFSRQWGPIIAGLEGDFLGSGIEGKKRGTTTSTAPNPDTYKLDSDWLATVRPRVGYAFGHIVPYVTGGLALADVRVSATSPAGTNLLDQTQVKFGWTAGAGVETAISKHLSVKAQYLYVDLANSDAINTIGKFSKTKLDENVMLIGVNYRFN